MLDEAGVEAGDTVCAHSSLSRLGYLEGGPGSLIDALIERVGPEGTVLMPSFPTSGSMLAYIEQGEPFDWKNSPSKVGWITEIFRRRPDVRRSLHPTNAVCAWGKRAEEYLEGHERSETAYGSDTPFGRLSDDPRAKILMIETHVHSYLHHLQERVDFPHLFLEGHREAAYLDRDGTVRHLATKVMRPRTPYFVAISDAGDEPDHWAILHDFCLQFPPRRRRECAALGYHYTPYPTIPDRHERMAEQGILRKTTLGRGSVGCLHVQRYLRVIEPEFLGLLDRFRDRYDPDRIDSLRLPYL